MTRLFLVYVTTVVPAAFPAPAKLDMFGPCKPIVTQQAPVHARSAAPRSYAMVYDFQGDRNPTDQEMANHLWRDHHINPSGMNRAQMAMAHDRAHGIAVVVPRAQFAPVYSNCPGGNCPLNQAPVRSRRRR